MTEKPVLTDLTRQVQRLFNDDLLWDRVACSDIRAYRLFQRHYSFRKWRKREHKNAKRFVGPGQEITLLTKCGKALFVWRKEKFRKDNQEGIVCAVFRNESEIPSSTLILAAEQYAHKKWPGERLFAYINPKLENPNKEPGYDFIMSGWKYVGLSKERKLVLLEKLYQEDSSNANS